jgi:uncharacterized protein
MILKEIKKEVLDLLESKLAPSLHFHSMEHTRLVYLNVKEISLEMSISDEETYLVKIAALYHDTGFLKVYAGHEVESCVIAEEQLPEFGISNDKIAKIKGMIMATKIPQSPKTNLENILCDADLMYLGTNRFKEIGDMLHLELNETFGEMTLKDWDMIQIRFLQNHHYHTSYCIEKYNPKKLENLNTLIEKYT